MIIIGNGPLTLEDFFNIVYRGEQIDIAPEALQRVDKNFKFLESFAHHKVIYGINTGLGPMAQYKIDAKKQVDLQYNLIRSHSAGGGAPLPERYVRTTMLARLSSLIQAHSGIHPEVIMLLKDLINLNINPVIPEHGGVGASGDLVQLAHLALVLIGEGEVCHKGKASPTPVIFKKFKLTPINIHIREGLGLINGTSAMTGIGIINLILAKNLLDWSILASSMINEIVASFDDHFSNELNSLKKHPGQIAVAGMMQKILADSKLIRRRPEFLYNNHKQEPEVFKDKVQEYYSLRCVPQILGPILDTIRCAEKVLINEVNSTNDNPIIDDINNNVFHGGNFHGDYVSLEMDKVKISITKLSMLAERQLNYLLNDKLNGKLPPFVNLGTLGLNLGMQGAQFTATSTVAENQTISFPMYVHSIPSNNDNQDIVSMGTNAALITRRVIGNGYLVMAIELITILQAIDYLKCQKNLSSFSAQWYKELRNLVPKFTSDNILYTEIKRVKDFIQDNKLNLLL
ncbi:MAG: aromatic amino acid lyase, partial [Bacteroidetes bacterium]|nr:aromatic amino acid lyase [Bacteroidota bacterium]